jgi:hypothetical protein
LLASQMVVRVCLSLVAVRPPAALRPAYRRSPHRQDVRGSDHCETPNQGPIDANWLSRRRRSRESACFAPPRSTCRHASHSHSRRRRRSAAGRFSDRGDLGRAESRVLRRGWAHRGISRTSLSPPPSQGYQPTPKAEDQVVRLVVRSSMSACDDASPKTIFSTARQ